MVSRAERAALAAFTAIDSLRQLASIIITQAKALETEFLDRDLDIPSPDKPYDPRSPAEALMMSPKVVESSMLLIAAADRLAAIVRLPAMGVFDLALGVGPY